MAETLEELRHHIEDLMGRLTEAEAHSPAAEAASPALPSGLDGQIESLGRKVDSASDLLAELTDLLESQTERIETIEQQIGEPDLDAPVDREAAGQVAAAFETPATAPAESAVPTFSMQPPVDTNAELREFLELRLDRLEQRIVHIQDRIAEVRALALERDRHVRDLEERLLILVDSSMRATEGDPPAAAEPVREPAAEAMAVASGATPDQVATASVLRAEPAPDLQPSDRSAKARLAELVEREVSERREFSTGAAPVAADAVQNRKSRPTVMVVDDASDARTILSIYLSKTGYQVVTAASAEDCLAKLRHHDVDAIVLDASMPGGSGDHVCRVLRDDAAYAAKARVPVIVYTAYPDEFPRSVLDDWKASDYVVKGGDMLPLITALVRHTKEVTGQNQ